MTAEKSDNKKRICLFYYDDFAEFEIVLIALQFMQGGHEIIAAALEDRVYMSEEKQRFLPDITIGALDPATVDYFIIPGGDPSSLYENRELREFLSALAEREATIAAVCGGSALLAAQGLLDGRRCTGNGSGITPDAKNYAVYADALVVPPEEADIVHDGPFITAKGGAFTDLALYLGRLINLYKDEEEFDKDLRWVKNIKEP